MSESGYVEPVERSGSVPVLVIAVLALLAAIGGLIWSYGLSNHLAAAEKGLTQANQENAVLKEKQEALTARLQATTETMGASVGMTQRQIELKTQSLLAAQRAANAETERLAAAQAANSKQITAVASDVSSVKTDVGGAKSDIAATRTDLESTKTQLHSVMGDAGVMSGLIAHNGAELELLKHRGDRTYLEFNLQKGAKPTLLSTIKIQAKKVDDKHSRYTMMVSADDRNIEKKDKSLDEPVQFYSGKDQVLYEIVVNSISKNQISGYLSIPKGAPQPMDAPSK
jgi:hypothetical protein